MSQITLRQATADDVDSLHAMLRLMAETLRPEQPIAATPQSLQRDGFGSRPLFEATIAEHESKPCGFALWTVNYSTWEGRPGIFIEDIFVHEHVRRLGVGRELFCELARIAVERGYARIDLNVLHWNPARKFYSALGVSQLDDWVPYRIEGAKLKALAGTTGLPMTG